MGKIYELYPKEQRKIDNQARRIRGYEKMRRDLQSANRKLNRENRELQQRIDKAIEFIQKTQFDCGDFNCCGFGIWGNGKNELLEILKGSDK